MATIYQDIDVHYAIDRIQTILDCGILNRKYELTESAFIEVMIRLSDLLQRADSLGKRIRFKDDVKLFPPNAKGRHGVRDITDAIRECRDAVCHPQANGHYITPEGYPKPPRAPKDNCAQMTFGMTRGKTKWIKTPQYTIESDYEDDVCFFFGAHRIYLNRHIKRAFKELKPIFPLRSFR